MNGLTRRACSSFTTTRDLRRRSPVDTSSKSLQLTRKTAVCYNKNCDNVVLKTIEDENIVDNVFL